MSWGEHLCSEMLSSLSNWCICGAMFYRQFDFLVTPVLHKQEGWRSTTSASGELCVDTGSTTMTPKLPATCSDLGIFFVFRTAYLLVKFSPYLHVLH